MTQNQILKAKAEKAYEKEEAVLNKLQEIKAAKLQEMKVQEEKEAMKNKLQKIKASKLQEMKEQEEEVQEIVELFTKIGPKNLLLATRVFRNYNLKYMIR